jgi:hypothetical protein
VADYSQQGRAEAPKTTKPNPENPYGDKEAVSTRISQLLAIDKNYRWAHEREWFRNVLFQAGRQWVIYDSQANRWRPKRLPSWYPRPVTNKFSEKVNDIVSSILQGRPPVRYIPATDDPDDMATAEVGERLREVMYEEAGADDLAEDAAGWLVLTGNVFLMPYYDLSSEHGTKPVDSGFCPTCQTEVPPAEVCPQCGGPVQVTSEEVPIGALKTHVLSPFEIRVDPLIPEWRNHRRFVRMKLYDLDFAKEYWSDFAHLIKEDSENSYGQFYLEALAYVTAYYGSQLFSGAGAHVSRHRVTAYEYYELPSADFPEGLRAVRLGQSDDLVVESGPLPYGYGAGQLQERKFLNLIHIGFDKVPGRFWRKTRLDDLIHLQEFRNLCQASLQLSVQRVGNIKWLLPKGSGVDKLVGEQGQMVEYNPVSVGGTTFAKPEQVPALLGSVAQPIAIIMNQIDDSMERVAGTFFLQGGDVPPGVTAASALAYLGERAERAMSPFKRAWARGWKNWEAQCLEILREFMTDERIRTVAGRNRQWETERFTRANLRGAVNMVIDYASLFPKSQATDRATIVQLATLGFINPADPEQSYEVMKKFGLTEIRGVEDLDVREAIKEAEGFLEGTMPELIPLVQNSIVHLAQHTAFAKTDEFKELPDGAKRIWYAHVEATYTDIIARQMNLAAMQAASDPQGGGKSANSSGNGGGKKRQGSPYGAGSPLEPSAQEPKQPQEIGLGGE